MTLVLFLCANICILERQLLFLQFFLSFLYKILTAPLFLDYLKILNCLVAFHFAFAERVPYASLNFFPTGPVAIPPSWGFSRFARRPELPCWLRHRGQCLSRPPLFPRVLSLIVVALIMYSYSSSSKWLSTLFPHYCSCTTSKICTSWLLSSSLQFKITSWLCSSLTEISSESPPWINDPSSHCSVLSFPWEINRGVAHSIIIKSWD